MSVNGEEKQTAPAEGTKTTEEAPPPPAEEKKPEEKKEEAKEDKKEVTTEKKEENGDEKKPEENGTDKKSGGFKERFRQFSKFGDTKSDGKMITLSQSDKWMKQAKVIDKKITTTDTGIYFKKFKMQKITFTDYEKFLEELSKSKKVELEEIKKKMTDCGAPGFTGAAGAGAKGPSAVERLTDPSKYTGSHKQRFDETGKGKGIAGRKDLPDKSGYVQGYQNKDTYNKTH